MTDAAVEAINAERATSGSQTSASLPAKAPPGPGNWKACLADFRRRSEHHQSIVDEATRMAPVLLELARKVTSFQAESMDEVVDFVQSVDGIIEMLEDEVQVLRFACGRAWPEKRYDALREAAYLHKRLISLRQTVLNYQCQGPHFYERKESLLGLYNRTAHETEHLLQWEAAFDRAALHKAQQIPWDESLIPRLRAETLRLVRIYWQQILQEVAKLEARQPPVKNLNRRCFALLEEAVLLAHRSQRTAGGFDQVTLDEFQKLAELVQSGKYKPEEEEEEINQPKEASSKQ